jgi:hypothetical protein
MYEARNSVPVEVQNVSTKGFYVFPDISNALAAAAVTGDGGISFSKSSNPDTYVFCHPSVDGFSLGGASMPQGRDRYNVSFEVHTATAPSWGGVI